MPKPQLSSPVPIRLPIEVLADIERIADVCERTRSWVMVRALRHYLAGEGADILAVMRGRQQAAAGDVQEMEDLLKEVEAVIRGDAA